MIASSYSARGNIDVDDKDVAVGGKSVNFSVSTVPATWSRGVYVMNLSIVDKVCSEADTVREMAGGKSIISTGTPDEPASVAT